jgi:hypothetical protein
VLKRRQEKMGEKKKRKKEEGILHNGPLSQFPSMGPKKKGIAFFSKPVEILRNFNYNKFNGSISVFE